MIKSLVAETHNRNSHSLDAGVNELADRFLRLSDPTTKNGFCRQEPFNGTTLKIEAGDNGLRIAYELTETEIATLQILSEVTGVSLNWLAKDAMNWTRGYISDLTTDGSGQVFDLIDDTPDFVGAACKYIPSTRRQRTRAFVKALKFAWGYPNSKPER